MDSIHQLYWQAYEKCRQARDEGKQFVSFRTRKGKLQLCAAKSGCRGKSSARMGLPINAWAANVLYRLQEEGLLPWSAEELDNYFEGLYHVGYDQ